MRLNSKQIVLYTGGSFLIQPIDASEILTGITWDSREVTEGDLYVALPGEHVDGHAFVEAAIQAGARGVLVSDAPAKSACILARELGVAIIEVSNTMHAIEDLARAWRGHITAKVVAVTGLVGKTTTKNLVRDVCASQFRTVATLANQNNELGVPNTLLAADPDTEVVVVEMGMRGLGQIRHLCDIARPDWGIITNVGESHMELLGTKDAIAQAKEELFDALPDGSGVAIVNACDEYSQKMIEDARLLQRNVHVVLFGEDSEEFPCVFARDCTLDAEGRAMFTLCARAFDVEASDAEPTLFDMEPDAKTAPCHLSVRGEHNVLNSCAAAAVGLMLGIDIHDVALALEESVSEAGRLAMHTARDGFMVINDAYNANPDSMRAALKMLAAMDVAGRRIAVLGDMGELGDAEDACHQGVGEAAAALGIDRLICVGQLSLYIADGAQKAGMPDDDIVRAQSIGEALEMLEGNLSPDDVVLVKASHFMRLDRIVEGLIS